MQKILLWFMSYKPVYIFLCLYFLFYMFCLYFPLESSLLINPTVLSLLAFLQILFLPLMSAFQCLLLLLLSHFSRVRLCATPQTAAHQAPPSLGFSRQEQWSGLPFPSPMHESEK